MGDEGIDEVVEPEWKRCRQLGLEYVWNIVNGV